MKVSLLTYIWTALCLAIGKVVPEQPRPLEASLALERETGNAELARRVTYQSTEDTRGPG